MIKNLIKSVFLFIFLVNSQVLLTQNKAIFLKEHPNWADSMMSTLTNDERIAQLFMVGAYSNKGDDHKQKIIKLVKDYKIGGLMFLQGGPVRQARLTNLYQSISKTPLMIAIDAEWGVAMRLDSSLRFPWQMTLGAIDSSELIYKMGVEIARQCKLLGVNINFAPVIDINSNPKNPIINNRSFGESPSKVGFMGAAYMKGLQDHNILACAKHFPGHGDTDQDSHKTLPIVHHLKYRLNAVELLPYRILFNGGLGSVMVAHLQIPSLDPTKDLAVSLSSKVVTGLLKEDMGFSGLIFTDALNMKGVSKFYSPGDLDVKALIAGNDILLFSEDVPKAIEAIKTAINENKITQEEIDSRCYKILLAKQWMGLSEYRDIDIDKIENKIITDQTILLDKKLVQSSLTLLNNSDEIIPLKRLDTLDIASVSIGENSGYFNNVLSKYASITHFTISENASISEQALLLTKLSKFNLVLASVHKSNDNAWKSYKISKKTDQFLQSIALQSKVIVSIFANPYSLNSLASVNDFDGLVIGYQNSKVAQEELAKAIFGGISFLGRVPVSTKHFNCDFGITTKSLRLNYILPAEKGISTNLFYKIDSIAENAIKNKAMPGCQILIAKDGDVFFNKSYGYHTYDQALKVRNSDIYDLASVTKIAATVPILMRMVDNGLSLDDNLGQYLSLDSTNKKDLIIREVLAHQAGLLPWIPFYMKTLEKDSISGLIKLRDTLYSNKYSNKYSINVADNIYLHYSYSDSIFKQIVSSALLEKKEYRYSDLGYYFFKQIIENSFGCNRSLDQLSSDLFYKKLGMENLGFVPLKRIKPSRIIPTEEDFEFRSQLIKGYVHDMGAAMQGGVGGHAGLFSNANDLAKLMQMYLQEGEYADERYLSADVVREFVKYQFPENKNRRGAGFDKPALQNYPGGIASKNASIFSFGHSGFTGTLAWADLQSNLIYIFLSNRIHPDSENKKLLEMDVRTEIMQIIYSILDEE